MLPRWHVEISLLELFARLICLRLRYVRTGISQIRTGIRAMMSFGEDPWEQLFWLKQSAVFEFPAI